MPRTMSVALAAAIQADCTTLVTLVTLTLRDGSKMGFSSGDQDLTYSSVLYKASSAVSISAFQQTLSGGVSNSEVVGILSSDRINETDIVLGKYDGAKYAVIVVNQADLTMGHVVLESGVLGQITAGNNKYNAEARGQRQLLKQVVGDVTSPTCQARRIGDGRCKLDMTSRRFNRSVNTVLSNVRLDVLVLGDPNLFANGVLTFTSGPNTGISRDIKSQSGQVLTLSIPFPYVVTGGDNCTVEEGCDRTLGMCQIHGNVPNFHGHPHVIGNDKLIMAGR